MTHFYFGFYFTKTVVCYQKNTPNYDSFSHIVVVVNVPYVSLINISKPIMFVHFFSSLTSLLLWLPAIKSVAIELKRSKRKEGATMTEVKTRQ